MHLETLSPESKKILPKLAGIVVKANKFIMAGGTALALQLGHRVSVDLDFFTDKAFSTDRVFQKLKRLKLNPVVMQEEEGTLAVTTNDVKISFLRYEYPFIEKKNSIDGIPLAGIIDIASMKVVAISQRGAKRDFVDLYFILQEIPFWKVAKNMAKRFGADRINPVHNGKGLVYFGDADNDPEPRYCGEEKPSWEDIKKFFIKNVQQMVLDMEKAGSE
jgi:predicted nucleotidyltransferase component of viral defense system